MKTLRILLAALTLVAAPAFAQEKLIASKTAAQYAALRPLTNGLSALSMIWPLNSLEENRIDAAHAGLVTVITASTPDLSAFEAETYREINSIDFGTTVLPNHVMLTLTAPHENFGAALGHLNGLLTNTEFSRPWYTRQIVQQRQLLATKTRRPENVLGVLTDYVLYPNASDGSDTTDFTFTFGMPSHVVLRTENRDIEAQLSKVLNGLDTQPQSATYPEASITDLPKGVIFAPDPDSRETLLYVVKTETFDGPDDQVGANLLLDYMGAYQGSEMFRVIRQEQRAAYNPASDFEQIGKNRAVMAMSATVLSSEWPATLTTMREIYNDIRNGSATDQGLTNNKRRMLGRLDHRFSTNPSWGASQYMDELESQTSGQVNFPLFRSIVNADLKTIRNNAADHMPPFEDYLVILIGGTNPPPQAMRTNGYCEQPLNKPLRHCLTQLR